ncbi:MAG: SRPBCC family protein [Microthrixaceae bacterium]
MDVTASLRAVAPVAAVLAVVEDLGTYPDWLDIVGRAEVVDGDPGDPGPAWLVDLRGQLGPLRRSKRIRMVRSRRDPDGRVTFERRELDGRSHSPWVLDVRVDPAAGASEVTMHLHYGGGLWVPLLDRVLADEIERSRPRLAALVEAAG